MYDRLVQHPFNAHKLAVLLAILAAAVAYDVTRVEKAPTVHAQQTGTPYDCSFTFTFTSASIQTGQPNFSAGAPCVAWRLTYTTSGFSSATVQFETSPDNSSFTAVPNTICSSTVQPPCVTDGASPVAPGVQGTAAYRAYGKYVHINVVSVSGSGSGAVVAYGYKGTSASAGSGGGGGGSPIAAVGPFANLPASGTQAGDLYTCTDSVYQFVWSGTSWLARALGYPAVVPPASGWVQVNFGSSTVANNGGVLNIQFQNNGSNVYRGYVQPKPGALYTVVLGCKNIQDGCGIGLYDNVSGLTENFFWGTDIKLHSFNYSATTFAFNNRTFNDITGSGTPIPPEVGWLRIVEDATHRTFYTSLDGITWTQQAQVAAGTYLVPTHVGVATDVDGISPFGSLVFSLVLTTP